MNRKEFQLWLEQFPEDTEIQVGIQQSPPDYCPYGNVEMTNFLGKNMKITLTQISMGILLQNPLIGITINVY